MTVSELLNNTKKTLFSFELLPPLRGNNINQLYRNIDRLIPYSPVYINITSHHDEIIYQKTKDNLFIRKIINRRPGSVAVAAAIKNKYKIPVVPHMICSGFTIDETENALIDLSYLGINDLLLLRGDKPRKIDMPEKDFQNKYALDLIYQVNQLNKGFFSDNSKAKSFKSKFNYGVAGYPEKHEEAPNFDSDIYYLKKKIKSGASYIVTQMFFDNEKFFDFVKRVRAEGINVPIVPGLKPVSLSNQINLLPRVFKTELPEALAAELRKCKTEEAVKEVGVEWTIMQSKELIKHNVPSLHFYTFLAVKSVEKIANQVF